MLTSGPSIPRPWSRTEGYVEENEDGVELEVTGVSPQGMGTAKKGVELYDVRGAVPGDLVEAKPVGVRGGRKDAIVIRRISESVSRTEPRCEHFGVCGGCQWQDVVYADQLKLKRDMVVECFRAAGIGDVEITEILGAEDVFYYRNKMDFSFGWSRAGELSLGLYEGAIQDGETVSDNPKHHAPPVFNLQKCWLQSEASNLIVAAVRESLSDTGLGPYNPSGRTGTLRSLVVRDIKDTGDVLVNLNVARKIHAAGVAEAATRACADVKGLVQSVNRKRSRNAVPRLQETVFGQDRIVEQILGLEVQLSATSFAQVNSRQAERLYRHVLHEARLIGSERILDLYCGAGTMSLLLAKQAASVTGVEVVEEAVQDARRNAERNGILNSKFVCKDVLDFFRGKVPEVDVVTVNPPRAGIYRAVLNAICRMEVERIVYVSCNAKTLARDLVGFKRKGYRVGHVQLVDLFPHTHHCEAVVSITRGRS